MKCCGSCFEDRVLKDEILRLSDDSGNCEICLAQDTPVVDAKKLSDKFELVCDIYEEQEDGEQLVDWLIKDWELFAVERNGATTLLIEILGSAERVRRMYQPSAMCVTDSLGGWESLRDELRTRNRFFPDTRLGTVRVGVLLENLEMGAGKVTDTWFRARIEDDGTPIPSDEMGAPPPGNASSGRANPVGIPYLYVGSEPDTAVTEVRPQLGETLTVAKFTIEVDAKVVDLRSPRQSIAPFLMEDIEDIAALRGHIDFFERLGRELKTPIVPSAAAVDYIPSQYLCELIKKVGYDGVVYGSSVSSGVNLALFQPWKATVEDETFRVKVDNLDLKFSPYP